jgi:hypothetical protein
MTYYAQRQVRQFLCSQLEGEEDEFLRPASGKRIWTFYGLPLGWSYNPGTMVEIRYAYISSYHSNSHGALEGQLSPLVG